MDDIILAAYSIAVGSAQWHQLAAKLAESLGSKSLVIFLFDDRTVAADLLAGTSADDHDRFEAYLAIARRAVPRSGDASRTAGLRRRLRVAAAATSAGVARWNLLSDSVADRYVAGMAVGDAGEGLWLCLGLDAANAAVAEEVYEKVEIILPHLSRAVEIDRRLRAAAHRSSFCDAVFDRLPFGLVQFDLNAVVLYSNAAAERISRLREGFVIASRRARAGSAADDAMLQSAIHESISTHKAPFSRWLNVKRGRGRRPYGILVTTMSGVPGSEASALHRLLFITDPERPLTFDPVTIAEAFGLTMAEARVVARLAMGISLPDIAGDLKVSINTVRTLLARAMGKTATNTQVALVRMVLTTFSLIG